MEEGNTLNELVLYQDGVRYDVSASDHGSPGTFNKYCLRSALHR